MILGTTSGGRPGTCHVVRDTVASLEFRVQSAND